VHWDLKTNMPTVYTIHGDPENTNVVALSQAPDGTIWVGTFGNGITRFDGTSWQSFNVENGLPGSYINDQTITLSGELWLVIKEKAYDHEPEQDFHLGRFDGKAWIELNDFGLSWIVSSPNGLLVGGRSSVTYNPPISLLLTYDGLTWTDLIKNDQELSPLWAKAITAITVAPDETIWVATKDSVFRYENEIWKKIKSPLDDGNLPQASSITVSQNEIAWFAFSYGTSDINNQCGVRYDYGEEQGVYRFDGNIWTHFTSEDGLVDNKICAITIDADDNVWFGSYDKGVSRFDGKTWTSYVIP
jgi:ligand-binding sensor domain-containing protein